MENKPKRPASKKLLYILIILVVFFALIEVIFSIFFYHQYGKEKLATIEALKMAKQIVKGTPSSVNVENQKTVRPGATEEMNRLIAEETHNSNRFEYEPWIEFKNIDFQGKYVNVSASQRRSIPSEFINPSSKDTIDIFFFGGSTTLGFNVADEETIPSQF